MKTKRDQRGEVTTVLLIVLAAFAFGPKIAPKFFDGRSKDAENSKDASAEVERRVAEAAASYEKKSAVVSASINQMNASAAGLPDSPQRTFILREGAWLSPLLPPPDPKALQAAYERRIAIEQGKTELADKLYKQASKENADLLAKQAKLANDLANALAERRAVDAELAEAAAYARGKDMVIGVISAIAVLLFILWLHTKSTTLPRIDVARMANRAREVGGTALDVIDAVVPDSWHNSISKKAAKLRAKRRAIEGYHNDTPGKNAN